ncbi:SDR family oxidoreductase [Puia sp. P3]|uniref:SDR family oxidoreductase n=1 Tax=Puia sp. P3 TaxID=3423952 RepID=UPI003D66753E
MASKHGVVGLTKTAALENAKQGVRINAVCPGVIRTAMIDRITGKDKAVEQQFTNMEPVGRFGEPSEAGGGGGLAVFGCRVLRYRPCYGRRRWLDCDVKQYRFDMSPLLKIPCIFCCLSFLFAQAQTTLCQPVL